mgnify:CR=1 FL=1
MHVGPILAILAQATPPELGVPPAVPEQSTGNVVPDRAMPSADHDIVVTAIRLRATIAGPIEAEQSIDEGAIAGLGASNLADVLKQLAAQTGGSQGRSGGGAILLVNGRRIGSFDEVRNLPPEAIQRIDILPEEAALRLGYAANSKPINVVLKPSYAAATGELEDRVTTRGLRNDFNTELNAVDIAGDNRVTFNLQYQIGDAITEAKRHVARPLDARAASESGLLSNPNGGALTPTQVALIGLPNSSRALGDFLSAPVADTSGRLHTLLPSTRQFTADGVFAQALGGGKALTVSGKFDSLVADDLLGPAISDVQIPLGAGNPFATPVRFRRILPGQPLVTRQTKTDTWHMGTLLAGYGRWQWSALINYDRIDQSRLRRGGLDTSAYQAALNAGQLTDPFSLPDANLLGLRADSKSASHDQLISSELFTSGDLFAFRGGSVSLSLRGTLGRETISTNQADLRTQLVRNHAGGLASFDIPLLSRSSAIGAVDASVNAGADRFSDAGSTDSWGTTLNWKPTKRLSLLLARTRDQLVPGVSQLGGTVEATPDTAFYDHTTGQSLILSRIDGGNLALAPDRRTIFKAELGWKPVAGLNVTAAYTDLEDRDAVMMFPGITSVSITALPSRFLRNLSGAITAVDVRPFNAELEQRQELKIGLSFSKNFSGGAGPKVPGGGGFGGGHSFGAQGSMIQLALTDTVRLKDTLQLSPGAPVIDLIQANGFGDALRVPRHRIEAQISGTHHGFGLRSNAVWTSGGAAGAGEPGRLNFGDRFALNFRLFYYPASNEKLAEAAPWLKGVRFLIAVDNAFDSYQRVSDGTGLTPLAYQRGLLDPIGRTFRFSIRKTID